MTHDTALVVIASVTSIASVVVAVVTALSNRSKLKEIHVSLNSRLSELLTTTGISSRAQGNAEGVAAEQARLK